MAYCFTLFVKNDISQAGDLFDRQYTTVAYSLRKSDHLPVDLMIIDRYRRFSMIGVLPCNLI